MPWYDYVWRSAILAISLLIVTRVMGKRIIAELTPIDFVAGITVGTIAGSASITASVPIWGGLLAVAAWALFQILNAVFAYRIPEYQRLVVGAGVPLVKNGHILRKNLAETSISEATIRSELRNKKVSNIKEVKKMVLDPSGKMGVVVKKKKRP